MPQVSAEFLRAARALGKTLKQTPPLYSYADAAANLDADGDATALLDELAHAQAALRSGQAASGDALAETTRLRALQNAAQANATIAAYLRAQQAVQNFLPQVNQAIGEQLGIDFAALGKTGGGG